MPKIAFIGAGSFEFTRNLVRDILTFPALADSTIALMDIDAERLDLFYSSSKAHYQREQLSCKGYFYNGPCSCTGWC